MHTPTSKNTVLPILLLTWPAILPRIHTFSWGREAEMVVKETMSEKNMVTFFLGWGGT